MSLNSYNGRQVDIHAFQGATALGDVLLDYALAANSKGGNVIAGIMKLGQRFLLELLTESGSIRHLPARGSSFLREVRQGGVRTQADLLTAFSRALIDVRRNLEADESDITPLDEQYLTSEILNVTLVGGNAVIKVSVTSRDPNVTVLLPVAMTL